MKFIIKIILFSLWIICLPIILILANNRFFYFINHNNLIISMIFLILFLIVFTITLIVGFNDINKNEILTEEDENPVRKLFNLAQKYHLDLEINDALKIYDEIKEKYPKSIYEREAQIEINRIKRNNVEKNNSNNNEKLLQILKIKYAKGEISKQEYSQKKKDLELN